MKSVIFCSTIERSSRISASSTLCVRYVLNIPRWNSIMGGKNKFQRKFAENFPRLDRSKMWLRKTAKIYAPVSTNDNLETNSGYFPSEQTSWSKCYCNCFCKSILDISKIHRRGNLKKKEYERIENNRQPSKPFRLVLNIDFLSSEPRVLRVKLCVKTTQPRRRKSNPKRKRVFVKERSNNK